VNTKYDADVEWGPYSTYVVIHSCVVIQCCICGDLAHVTCEELSGTVETPFKWLIFDGGNIVYCYECRKRKDG